MMRLSDLLGAVVQTENGRRLGHVHDVRVERVQSELEWRVKGIVVGGRKGLIERVGLKAALRKDPISTANLVDWQHVVRMRGGTIVVAEPGERGS